MTARLAGRRYVDVTWFPDDHEFALKVARFVPLAPPDQRSVPGPEPFNAEEAGKGSGARFAREGGLPAAEERSHEGCGKPDLKEETR